MNLIQTQESIVPEQSVIDSWPKMYRKKSTHACQGKCADLVIIDEPAAQRDEAKHLEDAIEAAGYVP